MFLTPVPSQHLAFSNFVKYSENSDFVLNLISDSLLTFLSNGDVWKFNFIRIITKKYDLYYYAQKAIKKIYKWIKLNKCVYL